VLEQQGRDALVVHVVGHRERDLGLPGVPGEPGVAGHAEQFAVAQRERRRAARRGIPADPPGFGLGGSPTAAEEAQVDVVGAIASCIARTASKSSGGLADLDRRAVGQGAYTRPVSCAVLIGVSLLKTAPVISAEVALCRRPEHLPAARA
jgi:hypothetical protein